MEDKPGFYQGQIQELKRMPEAARAHCFSTLLATALTVHVQYGYLVWGFCWPLNKALAPASGYHSVLPAEQLPNVLKLFQ